MTEQKLSRASGAIPEENMGDLPPAYDALSIYQSTSHDANQPSSSSVIPGTVVGPSRTPPHLDITSLQPSVLSINKSLPSPPPSSLDDTPSSSTNARPVAFPPKRRPRKNSSWLSLLLPSSFSAKKARQSVLSILNDLATPPSHAGTREQENVHETLAFLAETCAEHMLSLSTILQETSIRNHTAMHWAVVNYRQELLVALLVHSRPLTTQTISDIRRACLVSSNQTLFHALRVRKPPFHVTDGIQIPSLRAASNDLLLGNRPTDEISVQQASEQGFIVSFDIPLWQRRLKTIGHVDIEFIASGRMWSVTFFSAEAKSKATAGKRPEQDKSTWHVMVSLLESSQPTFFDSQLVVDALPPLIPNSTQKPRLRGARSTVFPPRRGGWHQSRSYDCSHDGRIHPRSRDRNVRASRTDIYSSAPTHPRRSSGPQSSTTRPPSISIPLGCGKRKLGCPVKSSKTSEHAQQLTIPLTWSDHGVGYTNAAVSPLGKGLSSQLLYEAAGGEIHEVGVVQGLYHLLAECDVLRSQWSSPPYQMVVQEKYHDGQEPSDANLTSHILDAPPPYESITPAGGSSQIVDAKPPRPSLSPSSRRSGSFASAGDSRASTSRPVSRVSQSNPSSWLSMLSFSASRTSKQVRQTVLALVRDLVVNVESPDLLNSCADACRTYGLDLSALLQEPFIEHHSAIYWVILNRRDTILVPLLAHATPFSQTTLSEIRLACLASSNQALFQSLRCQREPFTKEMTSLSTGSGTDALVLGSMPADEISIREPDGEGTFVAEIQFNLWQKRMRVSGRVSVEFIARGRIWSLTFFSPPSTTETGAGMWQVALCLLEHSPPTFVDSRLVIDIPAPPATAPQSSDLISLSPRPDDPNGSITVSSPPPSNRSKSKSKAIEVRLKSGYRLAYRSSNVFLTALDAAFSSHKGWSPPDAERWTDNNGSVFTSAIVVPLDEGSGAELLYANTPFISHEGALHVRLEARLGKPDATECIVC